MTRFDYLRSLGLSARTINRMNLKNVTRLPYGWALRVKRDKKYVCKSYPDSEYCDPLLTLYAAIIERDTIESLKTKSNTGFMGLSIKTYTETPQLFVHTIGKEKAYSIKKYGYLKTLKLALGHIKSDEIITEEKYLLGLKYLISKIYEDTYIKTLKKDKFYNRITKCNNIKMSNKFFTKILNTITKD